MKLRGLLAVPLLLASVARTGFDFDSRKARQALKAARPVGDSSDPSGARTALRDAVIEAVRLLGPGQSGDAVYLITDGFDTFSRAKDEEVEAALLGSGARLFAVLLPDRARQAPFIEMRRGTLEMPGLILLPPTGLSVATPGVGESGGAVGLRALVEASGGLGMAAAAVGTSAPRFDYNEKQRDWFFSQLPLLYVAMGEFYRLTVELPAEPDRLREWKVEVVGVDGKKLKDAPIVYPRKVAPCGVRVESVPGK